MGTVLGGAPPAVVNHIGYIGSGRRIPVRVQRPLEGRGGGTACTKGPGRYPLSPDCHAHCVLGLGIHAHHSAHYMGAVGGISPAICGRIAGSQPGLGCRNLQTLPTTAQGRMGPPNPGIDVHPQSSPASVTPGPHQGGLGGSQAGLGTAKALGPTFSRPQRHRIRTKARVGIGFNPLDLVTVGLQKGQKIRGGCFQDPQRTNPIPLHRFQGAWSQGSAQGGESFQPQRFNPAVVLTQESNRLQKTILGVGSFPIKKVLQRIDPNPVPQQKAHALVTFGRHRA